MCIVTVASLSLWFHVHGSKSLFTYYNCRAWQQEPLYTLIITVDTQFLWKKCDVVIRWVVCGQLCVG
jgi:hypothetical protein